MKQVTLGGDRLGSGNKQKIGLKNYERSTHDKGYIFRSTMSAGTLVPFMKQVATPGATFDINLGCEILTQPTIGPLFGSYKVQLDVFSCPMRLYHAWLHNNRLNIGMHMDTVKLPILQFKAKVVDPDTVPDLNNSQINPSSIAAYLGIRGIGMTNSEQNRPINGIPLLAYWDIYKNYYANKQEEIGAVIHATTTDGGQVITDIASTNGTWTEDPTATPIILIDGDIITVQYSAGTFTPWTVLVTRTGGQLIPLDILATEISNTGGVWTGTYNFWKYGEITILYWRTATPSDTIQTTPTVVTFPLENIDIMRDRILAKDGATAFDIFAQNLDPYDFIEIRPTGIPTLMSSQEGLALKTYQSDLFNNWLSTEWIDGSGGINEITSVDTTGDKFEINALILAKKVYDFLNRIAVSGGTYNDYVEAAYDHTPFTRAETPMYMGGLTKELIFQEVVSNSASQGTDGTSPLGTLAGRGKLSGKHKGGSITIKVDEHSYIIGIISLTPRIDYSQGNDWDTTILTMADWHVPGMDEIGFQESINEQRAWWSTKWDGTKWVQTSAGKIPAWINYMTEVNKTYGNFAIEDNEMFMTLNRKFEPEADTDIKDLTTYIDPSKFNNIFAETKIDAQNFWTQIAVDITARQKMSAKVMPNL